MDSVITGFLFTLIISLLYISWISFFIASLVSVNELMRPYFGSRDPSVLVKATSLFNARMLTANPVQPGTIPQSQSHTGSIIVNMENMWRLYDSVKNFAYQKNSAPVSGF